jgi:hypothetical protein
MNGGNSGSFNRQKYDTCNTQQFIAQEVAPLSYRMYQGNYENCNKCIYDQFYVPYQSEIVDVESELTNRTRPLSDCSQLKYSPTCCKSGMCMSTFDKSAPVVLAPEVCPIVFNNIPRQTSPGYTMMDPNFC